MSVAHAKSVCFRSSVYVAQLSIYSEPPQPVTLVETHTELERQIGSARQALSSSTKELQSSVNGVVEKWIGVEKSVESEFARLRRSVESWKPRPFLRTCGLVLLVVYALCLGVCLGSVCDLRACPRCLRSLVCAVCYF